MSAVLDSPRRYAGFTLVELLVGMAMLGLLFVVLFSGLRIALRSWETAERAWEATEGVGQALAFMERVLRDTRPGTGAGGAWHQGRLEAAVFGGRGRDRVAGRQRGGLGASGLYSLPGVCRKAGCRRRHGPVGDPYALPLGRVG